jgi:hypothetical protein
MGKGDKTGNSQKNTNGWQTYRGKIIPDVLCIKQ